MKEVETELIARQRYLSSLEKKYYRQISFTGDISFEVPRLVLCLTADCFMLRK